MTGTEQDEKAFMDAIWENPDDDNCRLVFADWFDDNPVEQKCTFCDGHGSFAARMRTIKGNFIPETQDTITPCHGCGGSGILADLNSLRAEMIRLQIDLSISEPGYSLDMSSPRCHDNSMNPKIKRAIELARYLIHRTSVIGTAYSAGNTIWRRGFVEEVHRIPWYDWWKYGDALRQWHPVRHVFTDRINIRRIPNNSETSVYFELTNPTTATLSVSKTIKPNPMFSMDRQEYNLLSANEALHKGWEIATELAELKWPGTKFHMKGVAWF